MQEDTQGHHVSLGTQPVARLSFLQHHAKRLFSSPNITALPPLNKPAPPWAPTVTSLQHEESAPIPFITQYTEYQFWGGQTGSLLNGSTRGIFRTGMGIMTNTGARQAPAKVEIWGCYPRVACAFQLAESESVHALTLCVHSSFQAQDASLTGRYLLQQLFLTHPFSGQHHRLQDSGIYYFNWGRSEAVRSLPLMQVLTTGLIFLIINPFLQEKDTTNPH